MTAAEINLFASHVSTALAILVPVVAFVVVNVIAWDRARTAWTNRMNPVPEPIRDDARDPGYHVVSVVDAYGERLCSAQFPRTIAGADDMRWWKGEIRDQIANGHFGHHKNPRIVVKTV